jgi:aminopeptidase N
MLAALALAVTQHAVTHYDVRLVVDLEAGVMRGVERVELAGAQVLRKSRDLRVDRVQPGAAVGDTEVRASGRMSFDYVAKPTNGFRLLADGRGMFTAFHCDAWMLCDNDPSRLATLRLELVVPRAWTAVGPGSLERTWTDHEGAHFRYVVKRPTQTFLFSFGAAPMVLSRAAGLFIYAPTPGRTEALRHTADARAFLRGVAGVDAVRRGYTQVYLPSPARGLGQEAAGMALMSDEYLRALERDGDVVLMAHELAHQWWGVAVGIRSWSDFWLNEGFAEYMALAYLERTRGRAAFDARIVDLRNRMDKIRADGRDRPLHYERWTDATTALGEVPYVKGALFLDLLRAELGDALFWRAVREYTTGHQGRLVESRDFQRSVERTAGRSLDALFRGVY